MTKCCDRGHPQKSDRVYIIRTDHGWLDGSVTGKVKVIDCRGPGVRVSYCIDGDDGYEYFRPKTRDCKE